MKIVKTYLISLQGQIFKLLPMKEDFDEGRDNHLDEYLRNLCASLDGALRCYDELSSYTEIATVQSNMWTLKSSDDIEFLQWRAIVLRSVRLVGCVLSRYYGGADNAQ